MKREAERETFRGSSTLFGSYLLLPDGAEVSLRQADLPIAARIDLNAVCVSRPVPGHPVVPEKILAGSAVVVPVAAVVVLEVVVVVLKVIVSGNNKQGGR